MTAPVTFAVVLVAAAVVAVVGTGTAPRARRRLRRLAVPSLGPAVTPTGGRVPAPEGTSVPAPGGTPATSGRLRPDPARLGAVLAGLAAVVLLGGWTGPVAAVPVAIVADRLLRRMEPATERRRRLREAMDLPLAADLLAAALRAGAPVDRAVAAVAGALDGPLGDRLGRVGRTLLLGGGPDEAWAHLGPVPGAERLAAAAVRSASSGAALGGALTRLADDLRADRAVAAEAAARRAGVLIVLPLGLCFLPAFILAGLVPVVVAVLGDVL